MSLIHWPYSWDSKSSPWSQIFCSASSLFFCIKGATTSQEYFSTHGHNTLIHLWWLLSHWVLSAISTNPSSLPTHLFHIRIHVPQSRLIPELQFPSALKSFVYGITHGKEDSWLSTNTRPYQHCSFPSKFSSCPRGDYVIALLSVLSNYGSSFCKAPQHWQSRWGWNAFPYDPAVYNQRNFVAECWLWMSSSSCRWAKLGRRKLWGHASVFHYYSMNHLSLNGPPHRRLRSDGERWW